MTDVHMTEYSVQFGKFSAKFCTEVTSEYRTKVRMNVGVIAKDLAREYISQQIMTVEDLDTEEISSAFRMSSEIPLAILEAVKASKDPIRLVNALASI